MPHLFIHPWRALLLLYKVFKPGQHRVCHEVLLNSCSHHPEWLTALNPILGCDQDGFLSSDTHTHVCSERLYVFAPDVKGFHDKCLASGSVLINLTHTLTCARYTHVQRLSVCAHRSVIIQSLTAPLYGVSAQVQEEKKNNRRKQAVRDKSPNFYCCFPLDWPKQASINIGGSHWSTELRSRSPTN